MDEVLNLHGFQAILLMEAVGRKKSSRIDLNASGQG